LRRGAPDIIVGERRVYWLFEILVSSDLEIQESRTMSEPAIFGLIRDGQSSFYADRWAAVFLYREILWGPEDFEAWVTQLEQLDEWEEECSGGVVADYDRRKLVWCGGADWMQIPRMAEIYHRLLQAAWPGFEVALAVDGMTDLAEAVGFSEPGESYDAERPDTVHEAAEIYDDEEDEEDDEDEEDEEDDEEIRAWVTIVEAGGAIRHRLLERLPRDLLNAKPESLQALADLRPAEVPPEEVVSEGMWIDESKKTIGVWGAGLLRRELPDFRKHWEGWEVLWAERGYLEQCEVSGPAGVPLDEPKALAKILPIVLSTKQFDISAVFGAIGGGLKKMAVKATGCLLFVLCLPLLIFGLVSGSWKPVLITVAIMTAVVIAAFKFIEYRFKRSFRKSMPLSEEDTQPPPVAGPLDEEERRRRVDQFLAAANLPSLADVEPLFPEESELDLLS